MKIYITGYQVDELTVSVPLSSSVILFLLKYCKTQAFSINIVQDDSEEQTVVNMAIDSLNGLDYRFIDSIPVSVANCVLPVIEVCTVFNNLYIILFLTKGSLHLMLSRQKFLTSVNIVMKRLFLKHYFFTNLCIWLFITAHLFKFRNNQFNMILAYVSIFVIKNFK